MNSSLRNRSAHLLFQGGRVAAVVLLAVAGLGCADEGMWLYNAPPRQRCRDNYSFELTAAWLEHVQQSSVRFNSGGSGSLVSAEGLILSNHHVGADALEKFGDEQHDYLRNGFYARTQAEEKRCLDLELNVLRSIEDVTEQVNAAVTPGGGAEAAFAARRAVMARIEQASLERTGLRSDVVTLYQGGRYHLYRFKKYTDVRLVFAPEQQIAFFGGDPDNFEYPRYNLDICLFRAYENGQPARIEHFLKWSAQGVSENDLVFVSGHPGNSERQLTVAELEDLRDRSLPCGLQRLHRLEVLLTAHSARSQENARRARDTLFGVQNGRKAREGRLAGLLDPQVMAQKKAAEARLRQAVSSQGGPPETASAWDQIRDAQKVIADHELVYLLLERGQGFQSRLFTLARTLLRAAEERPKPNGERLREFRDSNRESLEMDLFSAEPLYDDFEQLKLADSLAWLAGQMGLEHPLVRQALAGKSPRARAAALVSGTTVKAVAARQQLYRGGAAALAAVSDPMIELARLMEAEARRVRHLMEVQGEIKRQAHSRIAHARFALEGDLNYPDATSTLRLAYGVVKGYEADGVKVPFQTTFKGLFERAAAHHYQPPFDLPPRWQQRKGRLNLTTPFNFVSTADIIGGNSGSPVVNRQGELVGIIFDGNLQSLVWDFLYTEEQARAVSVNAQAILEALREIYGANHLVAELTGKKRP